MLTPAATGDEGIAFIVTVTGVRWLVAPFIVVWT
jgi:hypothetical protein